MTKLERLKKIGDHLEGTLFFEEPPIIHYEFSEHLRDDIPKAVQQSLVIQQIADDINTLRSACIPHLVQRVKGKQEDTRITILI